MDYKLKIENAKKELIELKQSFSKLQKVIDTLKVGDIVYEQGSTGYIDFDMFEQVILAIDRNNGKLYVHEVSIDKKKWITGFHLYENNKFVYYG